MVFPHHPVCRQRWLWAVFLCHALLIGLNNNGLVNGEEEEEEEENANVLSGLLHGSWEGGDGGVDGSWPMHHLAAFYEQGSALQKERYEDFMSGCYASSGGDKEACDRQENERLMMNRNQPHQMTNFTTLGYAKVALPPLAMEILSRLWNSNSVNSAASIVEKKNDKKNQGDAVATPSTSSKAAESVWSSRLQREQWAHGSIYINHWTSPTDMLDAKKFLSKEDLRKVEWQVKQVLEQWSGVPLVPTSIYGIRVYGHGSILAPHVDRLPLVMSAILHIDHDKEEEEWPLQVIGHDGVAVNLTLNPGEMILYEGASLLHGRPFPYQGHFYANLFVHFEPVGFTYDWKQRQQQQRHANNNNDDADDAATLFETLLRRQDEIPHHRHYPPIMAPSATTTAVEPDIRLPPYHLKDDTEIRRWRQDFQFVRQTPLKEKKFKRTPGASNAHTLAATGQLEALKEAVASHNDPPLHDPLSFLDKADGNGWKPIHEAARGGHVKILEYLIAQGLDVNERTNDGLGASPLWWTLQYFPEHHPAAQLLRKHGGLSLPPKGHKQ